MSLCNFFNTRNLNKDAPTPLAEDGEVKPDIVIPEKGEPKQCRCNLSGKNLRWFTSPVFIWVHQEAFNEFSSTVDGIVLDKLISISLNSGFKFKLVKKESDANIRIYMGELDGMNGTLGVAYQPSGGFEDMGEVQVMRPPFIGDIIIDVAENWSQSDFEGVMLHEILHALGLPHDDTPSSVMNPFFNGRTELGPTDVAALRERYPSEQDEQLNLV